jgi:uncharacterized protein YyaL (SSP411 family)
LLSELRGCYLPNRVLACRGAAEATAGASAASDPLAPLFTGKTTAEGAPVLYVCENFTCRQPAVGLDAARAAIASLANAVE